MDAEQIRRQMSVRRAAIDRQLDRLRVASERPRRHVRRGACLLASAIGALLVWRATRRIRRRRVAALPPAPRLLRVGR